VTRKKNQTKTNYVTQLIINQILSDEINKKKQEKNTIVMDKNEKEKKVKRA
jgi:hypothetical protein